MILVASLEEIYYQISNNISTCDVSEFVELAKSFVTQKHGTSWKDIIM